MENVTWHAEKQSYAPVEELYKCLSTLDAPVIVFLRVSKPLHALALRNVKLASRLSNPRTPRALLSPPEGTFEITTSDSLSFNERCSTNSLWSLPSLSRV